MFGSAGMIDDFFISLLFSIPVIVYALYAKRFVRQTYALDPKIDDYEYGCFENHSDLNTTSGRAPMVNEEEAVCMDEVDFETYNTGGTSRGKSCSNVDLTNESNGEFSNQQKFYTGDFSEDGFSSQNDRNTFSSSEDDTFSVDKGHSMYTSDTCNTDGILRGKSCSNVDLTNESNGEFSDQQKVNAKHQMPHTGSVQLSFSEYERSLKGCHRSGRKGRTDISKKKTSFSSGEFTDESNEEFSQQLKARK
ncbi:hypothetical protein Tcan_02614 [Toxocara canis]|uniref:Uncharacterized protein n=1 Tax=Toxocara canis TaxID=6265 RepID=A0A0B2W4K6_TOXCA|nr:hypothetical protein Tcan_02614 [Toxocara canis]